MKKFKVMSKSDAQAYSALIEESAIIISITDVSDSDATFFINPNIKGILRLKFDDVESDTPNHISREQAKEIIEFVSQHMDNIDLVIVHCGAGISRSAGVCAALMLIINGSDKEIFECSKYCPNRTCYRYILDAYYGGYDEDSIIEEKFKHNFKLWWDDQNLE